MRYKIAGTYDEEEKQRIIKGDTIYWYSRNGVTFATLFDEEESIGEDIVKSMEWRSLILRQ